ncbi:MAG: acyloxyacyl hydrolase [Pseudomonadota bacterium]|jgi:hypothetical protein|nr:acyloxyacyl hydrolase [Alphaproteobacteria bacterium]MEC7702458.1 acyloxyacyl hydrolase [Pseudomonadota bacterium]MEE3322448.1 acyloxyacyl hydrolase [Pseudomonadota bacterium]|tara:strand:+ start:2843 stop:3343 length:501 start_codon:yes stop_codon:yes gene_type:complete
MLATKKYLRLITLLSLLQLTLLTSTATAGDLSLATGVFDVLDDEKSVDFRIEYRFDTESILGIKPLIGIETSTDVAFHGLVGLYRDFYINDHLYVTPSLGGGVYTNGDGPDLNHYIQFRSMAEIGYKFNDDYKVSLGFSHTSNANLGPEGNSGTEAAVIYIHRGWP